MTSTDQPKADQNARPATTTPYAECPYRPSDVFRCEHRSFRVLGGRVKCFTCDAQWVQG